MGYLAEFRRNPGRTPEIRLSHCIFNLAVTHRSMFAQFIYLTSMSCTSRESQSTRAP